MCNGYAISGQKGIYSSVNVDGGDYNSTFGCGLRGRGAAAPAFSMEALAEFHIVRNVFSSGVWPFHGRNGQHVHQIGDEFASRFRLLSRPRQQFCC